MSVNYVIFSPRLPAELDALIEECEARLEAWVDEHGDPGEGWGEIRAGGPVPDAWRHAQPGIEAASRTVRGSIWIGRPDSGPLWNSLLERLLTRSDAALVCEAEGADGVLVPAAAVLAEVQRAERLPVFEARPAGRLPEPGSAPEAPATARKPRAAPDQRVHDLVARARRAVDAWEKEGLWELDDACDRLALAEALLEQLVASSGHPGATREIIDWILEYDGVAELYATNDQLEAALRKLSAS
jgi:hypothetical protein